MAHLQLTSGQLLPFPLQLLPQAFPPHTNLKTYPKRSAEKLLRPDSTQLSCLQTVLTATAAHPCASDSGVLLRLQPQSTFISKCSC